jgi:Flp pilus assembly protein TadG
MTIERERATGYSTGRLQRGAGIMRLAAPVMRKTLRRFQRDQSGSYTLIAALAMSVLIGVGALGSEAGLWYFKRRALQDAADSSAISAATAFGNTSNLTLEGQAVAASYGFVDGADGVTVSVNQPPTSGTHTTTSGAVEVVVTLQQPRFVSAIFNSQPVAITARAVGVGNGGAGCVLALNSSASGATSVQGSSQIVLRNCNLNDNSSSGSALSVSGNATLSARSVRVVGGISGSSGVTATSGITTGATAMADPYASASPGSYSGCDQNNFSAKNSVTISPGVYCGGMSMNAGATVTFNPGVYYLDRGGLSVAGNATLTGTGVTLVFTSSTGNNWANASISSNAVINLTAPTSGSTAGIVFFGDRSMPVGTSFKLNGGGSQTFGGALYLPKGALDFSGGSNTGTVCTQIIADTISFSGNSNVAVNCSGFGTKSIGSTTATLSE